MEAGRSWIFVELGRRSSHPSFWLLYAVTAFAKQTGDYAVLSHTDLCVLALTYAVEVEENGHWRVREELGKVSTRSARLLLLLYLPRARLANPGRLFVYVLQPPAGRPPVAGSTPAAAPPAALPAVAQPTLASAPLPITSQPPSTSPKAAPPTLPSTSTWGNKAPTTPYVAAPPSNPHLITVVAPASIKAADATLPQAEEQDIIYHDADEQHHEFSQAGPSRPTSPDPDALASGLNNDEDPFSEDDDEDAGEWITSTNISSHKARDMGLSLADDNEGAGSKGKKGKGSKGKKKSKPRAILKSACMTSDFAVQNVLLQMGLNLVGGEGRRIRSVRSWVLRCHACFK